MPTPADLCAELHRCHAEAAKLQRELSDLDARIGTLRGDLVHEAAGKVVLYQIDSTPHAAVVGTDADPFVAVYSIAQLPAAIDQTRTDRPTVQADPLPVKGPAIAKAAKAAAPVVVTPVAAPAPSIDPDVMRKQLSLIAQRVSVTFAKELLQRHGGAERIAAVPVEKLPAVAAALTEALNGPAAAKAVA